MIFDLERQDEGMWFEFFKSKVDPTTGDVIYDEPEKDAAKFRIRPLSEFWADRNKDRKKVHQMVFNPTTRAMERVSYYEDPSPEQEKKDAEDAWDYAITGIEGAYSAPGVKIDCTRENKLSLIKIPVFLRFLTRVFEIMSDSRVHQAEKQEKNSLSG